MLKIIQTLASGGIQNHEALDKSSLVVTPLAFLHHQVLSQGKDAEKAIEEVKASKLSQNSAGLGSNSNNNGDSVGEGFSILRMHAIVCEGRTFQVRIRSLRLKQPTGIS